MAGQAPGRLELPHQLQRTQIEHEGPLCKQFARRAREAHPLTEVAIRHLESLPMQSAYSKHEASGTMARIGFTSHCSSHDLISNEIPCTMHTTRAFPTQEASPSTFHAQAGTLSEASCIGALCPIIKPSPAPSVQVYGWPLSLGTVLVWGTINENAFDHLFMQPAPPWQRQQQAGPQRAVHGHATCTPCAGSAWTACRGRARHGAQMLL